MVQLKALNLLIGASISLTNSCSQLNTNLNCDKVVISTSNNKIELISTDYLLKENIAGYELTILNNLLLQKVNILENPEIIFCVNKNKYVAKGNPLFDSSIPPGAEYFYGLSLKNTIQLSSGNKIFILMTKKVSKK